MKAFYKLLLLFVLLGVAGLAQTQAQSQLRSRDDGGRPEEDNISGVRDDPSTLDMYHSLVSENGSGDDSVDENDSPETGNPSRLSLNQASTLSFDVYPNPASDFLQIQFGAESAVQVTLHNLMGKEVYHYSGTVKSLRIELAGINPGVYFVSAFTESDRIVRKIRVTP